MSYIETIQKLEELIDKRLSKGVDSTQFTMGSIPLKTNDTVISQLCPIMMARTKNDLYRIGIKQATGFHLEIEKDPLFKQSRPFKTVADPDMNKASWAMIYSVCSCQIESLFDGLMINPLSKVDLIHLSKEGF